MSADAYTAMPLIVAILALAIMAAYATTQRWR